VQKLRDELEAMLLAEDDELIDSFLSRCPEGGLPL